MPGVFHLPPAIGEGVHVLRQGRRPGEQAGLAEKLPNVKGYLTAAVAILAFIIFVWWGFFSEP